MAGLEGRGKVAKRGAGAPFRGPLTAAECGSGSLERRLPGPCSLFQPAVLSGHPTPPSLPRMPSWKRPREPRPLLSLTPPPAWLWPCLPGIWGEGPVCPGSARFLGSAFPAAPRTPAAGGGGRLAAALRGPDPGTGLISDERVCNPIPFRPRTRCPPGLGTGSQPEPARSWTLPGLRRHPPHGGLWVTAAGRGAWRGDRCTPRSLAVPTCVPG